jgi:ArsR family transcriptional regulator, lead/cadmium/zinc/bismuth-responsive transcriptional repressor
MTISMSRMGDDSCELLCLDLARAESLRTERLDVASATVAAKRASALGDPTRLMLAAALRGAEELCVCDLAWIAERAQNLVSHHMRMLRSAGVVESRRDGKMVMYSLTGEGAALLATVLDASGVEA